MNIDIFKVMLQSIRSSKAYWCHCALWCLLVFLAVGCAGDGVKDDGLSYVPGKADGAFDIREAGPLDLEGAVQVSLSSHVPAYRVESFGGTTLTIDLTGGGVADPLVVVEGPIGEPSLSPGAAEVVAQDDDGGEGRDSHLTVTLETAGVYRVLVGTYESLGQGVLEGESTVTLEARCDAICARPAMTAEELLTELRDQGQLEALVAMLSMKLDELVPDPIMRETMRANLEGIAASGDFSGLARFPMIPLRQVGTLRPALGQLPESEPAEEVVLEGELMALLGPCNAQRAEPAPVHASIPGLAQGHYPHRALTDCQVSQSQGMARVLSALGANNGSVVTFLGREARTPRELMAALIAEGHSVEVRNERTYANFIALVYQGRDVIWPVWLDTGEEVGGHPLMVPTGHSHHAWRIEGPNVNARVMFYLGISGAAFFAQVGMRPAWCGEIVTDGGHTGQGEVDHVLATFDAATSYLQRIRTERGTVAAGMPADGYGYLGVCNDSNAVLEYVTRGTITAFPLLRAADLDDAEQLGDGLDEVLRTLPHDGDAAPARDDLLNRVLLMTPHDLDSPDMPDQMLAAQLQAVQSEAAGF